MVNRTSPAAWLADEKYNSAENRVAAVCPSRREVQRVARHGADKMSACIPSVGAHNRENKVNRMGKRALYGRGVD